MLIEGSFFCHFYKHNSLEMRFKIIILIKLLILFTFFGSKISIADNHNIYETLETIQKDIKTLEKAVSKS